MNEKLLKFVEDLASTLRYHEHILQDERMKEWHEQSQICKEVLTLVYYEVKEILQGSTVNCPKCGAKPGESHSCRDYETTSELS